MQEMNIHQRNISIDDEVCLVTCVKAGKTVWKAYGDCSGRHLTITGTSENNAFEKWKEIALSHNG